MRKAKNKLHFAEVLRSPEYSTLVNSERAGNPLIEALPAVQSVADNNENDKMILEVGVK